MYRGVAIWNYAGDAVTNAETFRKAGFDAISWNAPLFVDAYTDADRERAAEFLKQSGMYFTMHNALPNPKDPKEQESARRAWNIIADWNRRHGLLKGMTFDFWYPHDELLPFYRACMDVFAGQDVFFACEDTPLDAATMEKFAKYLKPGEDVGILIDLGHMNLRQWQQGKHGREDFLQAFRQLPMKLRELHVSDNLGVKDDHRELGYGNLPLADVGDAVRALGFDGIVTVEIVNSQNWTIDEHIAHAIDTSNRCFAVL